MPYLRLDLAKTYPSETKRELATRLCHLYADVMKTQLWRPNVGIAELGGDILFHLGEDGLESVTMVLVEIRRGRSLALRLELGRRIVDICAEVLGVPKRTVLVEHTGEEILRDGEWAGEGRGSLGRKAGYVRGARSSQLKRTACRRAGHTVGSPIPIREFEDRHHRSRRWNERGGWRERAGCDGEYD
jgi:hypothetical protein